ncbi:MAG: caspase family protein [Magnetococcales bacterium]|nr:caspase family protein [Magnetococcales bacterium]
MSVSRFRSLSVPQFVALLGTYPWRRRITEVHLHHTWRPNHAQFKGESSIQAMWRYHTQEKGWSDIAQHLTIDPSGMLWLGRDWDRSPASATGFNGNSVAGPFMIEMVGDFDHGGDLFGGVQQAATINTVAAILQRFGLPATALKFHNQMSTKSCPGSTIGYNAMVQAVTAQMSTPVTPADPATLAGHRLVSDRAAARSGEGISGEEWDESHPSARGYALLSGLDPDDNGKRGSSDEWGGACDRLSDAQLEELKRHVVNLRQGCFSEDGRFQSSWEQIQEIIANIRRQRERGPMRLLLWAHGGLVSEEDALCHAWCTLPWWRSNGIYPIYFVWETGIMEALTDHLTGQGGGARGWLDGLNQSAWEGVCHQFARPLWRDMKASAARAFLAPGAPGGLCVGGGGWVFLNELKKLLDEPGHSVELHAVGHSAGSIFHAHLLGAANGLGLPALESLQFLAPAISIQDFNRLLVTTGLVTTQVRKTPAIFTMEDGLESQDPSCGMSWFNYGKSLLYMISNALEATHQEPILGLQKFLASQPSITADVIYSQTPDLAPIGRRSRSTTHGGFDNDADTMESVCFRILSGVQPYAFPEEALCAQRLGGSSGGEPVADGGVEVFRATQPGRRLALCVGIDRYAASPLSGCVRDALTWRDTLVTFGFQAQLLTDGQATRAGIVSALEAMIRASRPGDVLVWHYSGHGTQVPDQNGDDADGQDEAMCPVDYHTGHLLLDDDIDRLLDRLPQGVSLTCFLDCCHSGTISRMGRGITRTLNDPAAGAKARFLTLDEMVLKRFRKRSNGKKRKRVDSGLVDGATLGRRVVFSACRADEVAWESAGQGEFTLRATRILRQQGVNTSNRDFAKRVEAAFGQEPRQHPTLECQGFMRQKRLFT